MSRRFTPSAASSVATCSSSGPPSIRIVAPPGLVISAESPCPTSKNRTVSASGVPAPSAVDQISRGIAPTAPTTTHRGGRHPRFSQVTTPTNTAPPTTSTTGPPFDVTYPTGAFARVSAISCR